MQSCSIGKLNPWKKSSPQEYMRYMAKKLFFLTSPYGVGNLKQDIGRALISIASHKGVIGDCGLDKLVRGHIESTIDEMMQKEDFLVNVEWIRDEMPIESLKDLTLGYIVGGIVSTAVMMISVGERRSIADEDKHEIRAIIKRRLPEISGKINRELHG